MAKPQNLANPKDFFPDERSLRQKRSLGQVFLKDQNILRKTVEYAEILPQDVVAEVGCGEGWLSLALAKEARSFHVYELDEGFLNMTRERLAEFKTVEYHSGDILENRFKNLQEPFKVVANLPYYISAPFFKLLIESGQNLQSATIMVQEEFAKKIVAKPGSNEYTSLTIYLRFFLEIEYGFKVSRNCFRPIPGVDSAVVKVKPRPKPLFEVDEALFFGMVRSSFWARRKRLLNCLLKSPYLNLPPSIKEIPFFQKNPDVRGETLSVETFYSLYLELVEAIGKP